MSKTIKGQFVTFTGIVGTEDNIRVHLAEDGERGHTYGHVLNYSDEQAVTINSKPICRDAFLNQLQKLTRPVKATLYFEDAETCRTADFQDASE